MRWSIFYLLVVSSPLAAQVDSISREGPFTPDTVTEQPYTFTGREDPRLLARIFEATYLVTTDKDKRGPQVLCLAIGPDSARSDVSPAVLENLKHHNPAVRSWSKCPRQQDYSSRILTITSLKGQGDTVSVFSNEYVAPLWASGWHCRAARNGTDWRVFFCSMHWIS